MKCAVDISGACVVKTRQLASVISLKVEDFSLAFLSSSVSTYHLSQFRPYRLSDLVLEGVEQRA